MQSINYISHLNQVFNVFSSDSRLNTTHVSMYMALFHFWNNARFADEFFINRNDVMLLSKIGSKGTYHKCMRDLDTWQYFKYLPSRNPQMGSKIKMFALGTSTEQVEVRHCTKNGTSPVQVSGRYINNTKHKKPVNIFKPKNLENVTDFFISKNWHTNHAAKFFNHYESVGWKKGKSQIENWQAAAQSWMLQAEALEKTKNVEQKATDSLHTIRNKNYNQPL
ncbi:hypothetical protein [Pseudotamlana carrageenivorans]|nr:hypothetical protein [Tamlana carrageenivorans]